MTIIPISRAVVSELVLHKRSRFRHFNIGGVEVTYNTKGDSLICRKCHVVDNCQHAFRVRNSAAFRIPQAEAFARAASPDANPEK